ncbi:gp423 [Bacillus phage G]|uniref:Gp423 n=1 Tax=Bacillus phage G TaxID=2884420 RepID=G3MAG4_9CAUD|nr:gp423 [Bacillus phage G]AEO93681.1 gp423 [Bacillus phage G]
MTASFNRNNKGALHEDSNILSIFYGKDAYLLEDELNEAQWNVIEAQAENIRVQYTSGILSEFDVVQVDNSNAYIDSINGKPLTLLVDGYIVKVGGNKYDNELSSDSRVLFNPKPTSSGNQNHLHYLEFWFEAVSYASTLRKFGGEDTKEITNKMWDDRVKVETSRRIQMKWKVSYAQDLTSKGFENVGDNLWKKVGEPTYNTTTGALVKPGISYAIIFANGTNSVSGNPVVYEHSKAVMKDNNIKKDLESKLASSSVIDKIKQDLADLENNLTVELNKLRDDFETNKLLVANQLDELRQDSIQTKELLDQIKADVQKNKDAIIAMDKAITKIQVQLELDGRVPGNGGTFADTFDGTGSRMTLDKTKTDIINAINAGTTILPVASTEGFVVGTQITIFDDIANEEAIIVAIGDGTITIAATTNAYKKGAKVVRSNVIIDTDKAEMGTGYWQTYNVEVIEVL